MRLLRNPLLGGVGFVVALCWAFVVQGATALIARVRRLEKQIEPARSAGGGTAAWRAVTNEPARAGSHESG